MAAFSDGSFSTNAFSETAFSFGVAAAVTAPQRLNLKRGGGGYKPTKEDALARLAKLAHEFRKEEERQLPPPEPVVEPEFEKQVVKVGKSVIDGLVYIRAPKKPKVRVERPRPIDWTKEDEEVVRLVALMD